VDRPTRHASRWQLRCAASCVGSVAVLAALPSTSAAAPIGSVESTVEAVQHVVSEATVPGSQAAPKAIEATAPGASEVVRQVGSAVRGVGSNTRHAAGSQPVAAVTEAAVESVSPTTPVATTADSGAGGRAAAAPPEPARDISRRSSETPRDAWSEAGLGVGEALGVGSSAAAIPAAQPERPRVESGAAADGSPSSDAGRHAATGAASAAQSGTGAAGAAILIALALLLPRVVRAGLSSAPTSWRSSAILIPIERPG
jgi:hypothetical protein